MTITTEETRKEIEALRTKIKDKPSALLNDSLNAMLNCMENELKKTVSVPRSEIFNKILENCIKLYDEKDLNNYKDILDNLTENLKTLNTSIPLLNRLSNVANSGRIAVLNTGIGVLGAGLIALGLAGYAVLNAYTLCIPLAIDYACMMSRSSNRNNLPPVLTTFLSPGIMVCSFISSIPQDTVKNELSKLLSHANKIVKDQLKSVEPEPEMETPNAVQPSIVKRIKNYLNQTSLEKASVFPTLSELPSGIFPIRVEQSNEFKSLLPINEFNNALNNCLRLQGLTGAVCHAYRTSENKAEDGAVNGYIITSLDKAGKELVDQKVEVSNEGKITALVPKEEKEQNALAEKMFTAWCVAGGEPSLLDESHINGGTEQMKNAILKLKDEYIESHKQQLGASI